MAKQVYKNAHLWNKMAQNESEHSAGLPMRQIPPCLFSSPAMTSQKMSSQRQSETIKEGIANHGMYTYMTRNCD